MEEVSLRVNKGTLDYSAGTDVGGGRGEEGVLQSKPWILCRPQSYALHRLRGRQGSNPNTLREFPPQPRMCVNLRIYWMKIRRIPASKPGTMMIAHSHAKVAHRGAEHTEQENHLLL